MKNPLPTRIVVMETEHAKQLFNVVLAQHRRDVLEECAKAAEAEGALVVAEKLRALIATSRQRIEDDMRVRPLAQA